ncbi:MAG: DNA methyltransferase [Thermoguttaceae bacterium]
MADPQKIENAIRCVRNQKSFIQELLIDALGWDIDEHAEDVEDITFEWSADELRANDLDKHIVDGTIRQIRPVQGNPWGIFLLEFRNPDVFVTGRGLTGTLRNVLRGLVPSKKKRSSLASFRNENLLFLCNHDYKHYRFAHFKTPCGAGVPPARNAAGTAAPQSIAPLAAFGWGPGDPIRTLCEYNLNALEWPDGQPSPEAWVAAWSQAFDVEKVTKRFYEDYATVFERVEKLIGEYCKSGGTPLLRSCGVPPQKELKGDDLRMFTQTLFNRLMFLRFMERKAWLTFGERKDYLRAIYAAGGYGKQSFYKGRLCPLFFEGLAVEGKQQTDAYGCVPCLNGGLFERSELDKQVTDLPDEVFAGILSDEHAGGLFYRYNFTVEESTPLDIEVAVDPEMLGKVFEELVTGRHESGSYYTPRPVVSFMCREALKGHLSDRLLPSPSGRGAGGEGAREKIEQAITALVDQQNAGRLKETQAREILAALDDLKAVDPACGSGAYLLGLLQEMIVLYRLLYSEKLVKDARTLYDLKLRIISQSLYGVDIDPFATNIAKLRL